MNYFSHIPLGWSGLILILSGLLMIMISVCCNHDNNMFDEDSSTPWEWTNWLELQLSFVLNPVRPFVTVCGIASVGFGVIFILGWLLHFVRS